MDEIEKDIRTILKKHGYKSEGATQVVMNFDQGKIPEINIQYSHVEKKS